MTLDTARAELSILRGYQENGSLALHKDRLNNLYRVVCGKSLPTCNCKNKLDDAIIEIYVQLKRENITEIMERKAKLVQGVALLHVEGFDGVIYTNHNLTDEVARAFLKQRPDRKDWFEVLPGMDDEQQPKKRTRKTKK